MNLTSLPNPAQRLDTVTFKQQETGKKTGLQ